MLTLPLWIVTEHIQPTNPEHTPEQEPGTALAFSTSSKLFKFMKSPIVAASGRCKWLRPGRIGDTNRRPAPP